MNKKDLRYIKTERLIKKTFLKCIDQKGFEKTTISDICQLSEISRNTFYLHFLDKYDLLDSLYDDLRGNIVSLQTKNMIDQISKKNINASLNWYIDIVVRNHEMIRILLKAPTEKFIDILYQYIMKNPILSIISNLDELSEDLYLQLDLMYMFNAMISFTQLWLEHYDELSVENVKTELGRLCDKPVQIYFEKIFDNPKAVFI